MLNLRYKWIGSNQLNILIVSQYFWPEPFIINDLVLKIKAQGHNVTIFTGKPNYPDGKVYPGYKSTGVQEELYDDGIEIYRIPLRPRHFGGGKNLVLNYLSFVFSGLRHAFSFSKKRRFDSILVFCPSPITASIPAILIKWLTKAHLAIWVQDLWPESLQATGFIRNRFVLACVRNLVRGIYYFSDTLLVQSRAFIKPVSQLAPNKDIIYYPNSAIDSFDKPVSLNSLPENLAHLLDTQFCMVFAGNIGTAQAVETIVEAAIKLKDMPELKLILVGSGTKSSWVEERILESELPNLVLAGRFPPAEMPQILSKASGLLVTLKRDEIFSCTIPSKIQTYLAAGKPIIAALDGEGAKVITEAGAGLASPAEDAEKLANNIKNLYHMSSLERDEFGKAGRLYFLEHFEMDSQGRFLTQILEAEIVKRGVCK